MKRSMMCLVLAMMSACGCAGTKQVPPDDAVKVIVRSMPIPKTAQFKMLAELPDCGAKFEKLFILMPGATSKIGEWHVCDDAVVDGLPGFTCTLLPTVERTMNGSCKLQVTEEIARWAALPKCNIEEEKLGLDYLQPGYLGSLLVQYDGNPEHEYSSRVVPVDAGESLPAIYGGFDRSCVMWVYGGPRATANLN